MKCRIERTNEKYSRAKEKREHQYNPEFIEEILRAEKAPTEKTFRNLDELLQWLDKP